MKSPMKKINRYQADPWHIGHQQGDQSEHVFRYKDKGTMATISRFRAVASIGRFKATGFIAWVMWLVVHLIALTGFRNRIAVLFHWVVAFVGNGRHQRAITAQQVFAREALSARDVARIPGSGDPSTSAEQSANEKTAS